MLQTNKLRLNLLQHQKIGDCQNCNLSETRKNIVFGSGNPDANIMIVGEAPGADEDEQGIPFVGRSGSFLNELFCYFDLKRCDIYIANILKCRPPNNRNPDINEINQCIPFLEEQIKIIKPKVIIALGLFSAHFLSGKGFSMGYLRDLNLEYTNDNYKCHLVCTYHPSYILRKDGKFDELKPTTRLVISDFKKAMDLVS